MDVVSTQRRMARRNSSDGSAVANVGTQSVLDSAMHASSKSGVAPLRKLRKSRSRSAPASLRKRHPLIEDHYRVDREKRVVLPGVPKQEDDFARDLHDFFNLIVLVPVVVLNMMNWNLEPLLDDGKKTDISDAWTGEWFEAFFQITAVYFVADLVWVSLVPSCVKSPGTIIQHHIATLLYILIPYYYPEYRWLMGACMLVEINTWFLIARRVFNKQGFPPWVIDLPPFISIRVKLISIFFYTTWIGIRCILYPIIFVVLSKLWVALCEKHATRCNVLTIALTLHSVFCLLNFKWTLDLLMSKVRYWRKGGDYKVDKGL